ncbi:MAG TPA: hypothetical protein VF715_11985 [Thermoleophilaceae bacterium]|jgi:hypothetical protein
MTDDPGVMGNLPRSRPGRRSEKRASEVKPPSTRAKASAGKAKPAASAGKAKATAAKATAAKATPKASRAKATPAAAKPKPRTSGKPRATTRATAPPTAVRDERVEERQGQDPITAALKLGMAVGDAGVKAVAKIVQRLPRP